MGRLLSQLETVVMIHMTGAICYSLLLGFMLCFAWVVVIINMLHIWLRILCCYLSIKIGLRSISGLACIALHLWRNCVI